MLRSPSTWLGLEPLLACAPPDMRLKASHLARLRSNHPQGCRLVRGSHPNKNFTQKNREEGIRTPGGTSPTQPFQDCTLSHSDTSLNSLYIQLNPKPSTSSSCIFFYQYMLLFIYVSYSICKTKIP